MNFYEWMCGGPEHKYQTIVQSMDGDVAWYSAIGWISGFILIESCVVGYYFYINSSVTSSKESAVILKLMSARCVAIGISGFMFNFIRLWFPVFKLQIIFLLATFALSAILIKRIVNLNVGFSRNKLFEKEQDSGENDAE